MVMENDGMSPKNDGKEPIESFTNNLVDKLKIRSRKKNRTSFKKGHQVGKRFGEGQPTNLGGRKPSSTTVFNEMKAGLEDAGYAAREILNAIVDLGLDKSIEPRFRFPFLKEAALRVFGPVDYAIDESIKQLKERQSSGEKQFELSIPLLEAAVVSDSIALVRELMKQGKLTEVVKQIEGEDCQND